MEWLKEYWILVGLGFAGVLIYLGRLRFRKANVARDDGPAGCCATQKNTGKHWPNKGCCS